MADAQLKLAHVVSCIFYFFLNFSSSLRNPIVNEAKFKPFIIEEVSAKESGGLRKRFSG